MLDRPAVQALRKAGQTPRQIARQLEISRRSVQRIANEPPVDTAIVATARAATMVGSTAFTPALLRNRVDFAFNPVPNEIRAQGSTGQNLRLVPRLGGATDGTVAAVDATLSYALGDPGMLSTPAISGTAYPNSVAGATSTMLYAIDFNRDVLTRLANPNDGVITTVGSLGVNTTGDVGFDIAGNNGSAYVSLTVGGGWRRILRLVVVRDQSVDGQPVPGGWYCQRGTVARPCHLAVSPASRVPFCCGLGARSHGQDTPRKSRSYLRQDFTTRVLA